MFLGRSIVTVDRCRVIGAAHNRYVVSNAKWRLVDHGPSGCARTAPAAPQVHSTLYQLVGEYLQTFLAQVEAQAGAGLPQFVRDEFEAFPECGILAHGFLRLWFADCTHEKLVAFSCKRRGSTINTWNATLYDKLPFNFISDIAPVAGLNRKLRALAVTVTKRADALPNVPTMADFLPGFEATGWQGIGAPKNTPADIIVKLNREINAGLADPNIQTRIANLGATLFPSSPAELGHFIASDTEKWAKVVRFAGIKAD